MQTKRRVLIIGSNGFLGHIFMKTRPFKNCLGISGLSVGLINITKGIVLDKFKAKYDFENLSKVIKDLEPSAVLNLTGLIGEGACKNNPKEAMRANIDLPLTLAKTSREINAKFIHFSTDAVFGDHQIMRSENIPPQPSTIYGKTKLEGEVSVLAEYPASIIVRTNVVGVDRTRNRGLFNFFANNFMNKKTVTGYQDVFFNPISVRVLKSTVETLLRTDHHGVFHVAGATLLSKYEFGEMIAVALGIPRTQLNNYILKGSSEVESRKNLTLETDLMKGISLKQGVLQEEVRIMCQEIKK